MEWSTALAVVPAVTAGVAVLSAIGGWWRARNWSSLDDARKMLEEVSVSKDPRVGSEITDRAAEAATGLMLELATRAQLRAKRVARRNDGSHLLWSTIGACVLVFGMSALCSWGFVATILGESILDVPLWATYVCFGLFAAGSAAIGVMLIRERVGIWRRTRSLRSLYKDISWQNTFLHMPDTPKPAERAQ
ncbi:hypothetical protein [Microbacterium oxydans]|uniref:hypothetical protein n=1 Tax=Microbacterium oxydans TaxID=82380 RepID=UPI00111D7ECF|nr:hypothetical protein [Microbacterium oxydans]